MKNISFFLSENFQFLEVKFSIYLNRRVFVMGRNLTTEPFITFPSSRYDLNNVERDVKQQIIIVITLAKAVVLKCHIYPKYWDHIPYST